MSEAPKIIKELVEQFETNLRAYKSPTYKEEQLKQDFINKFFQALGWDVDSKKKVSPQHREVIFEDSIKVAGGTKAPDYCFTLSGRRMFFVEAKKPSVHIKKDIHPAFQLRRYAWSAKLPLSILTDFEEFAVYEIGTRPKKDDKADKGRVYYYTYKDYIDKWDEISSMFSYEAAVNGYFDRYTETIKKKRGTQEVDHEFLTEIESWRDTLAKNIALRNTDLTVPELNYAVQRTVDRIIFLRMCEDRGIERYGTLKALLESDNIYTGLCEIYKKADEKYNSGLFHFKKEKERDASPDELTLSIHIDDKVLKQIIKNLYYPESPYEFSVLPPEILGNVYEQFLGKVIRLTAGHQAKVETKPEVKKAGGVYYTPKYVVDYIVKNTVGKLIKGKTPKQISELRILDPACGSGSFLLGAYTYLLNYHLEYYAENKNPQRYKNQIYQGLGEQWFLTIKEKKRILLNNIYGVDIDQQAVEVTKLSLLLKVLEGEIRDIFEKQQKLWRERALPDLSNNIKCGNSLIGPDFYDTQQTTLFDENGMRRINVFDWNDDMKGFGKIMERGGFDCVIGNPPYIKIQVLQEFQPKEVDYLKKKYFSASSGSIDIYVIFIEKALDLISKDGLIGYICPHKFLNSNYGKNTRTIISEERNLVKLLNFGINQVFENATTYTCLLFLSGCSQENFEYFKFKNNIPNLKEVIEKGLSFFKIKSERIVTENWIFTSPKNQELLKKINFCNPSLGEITTNIFQGPKSGADPVFIVNVPEFGNKQSKCYSKSLDNFFYIESDILKPYVKGKNVRRYYIQRNNEFIIFPYTDEGSLIPEKDLKKNFPLAFDYLSNHVNKKILLSREKGRFKEIWWSFSRPQNMQILDRKKILTPFNAFHSSFSFDDDGDFIFSAGVSGAYGILLKEEINIGYKYLLGILNSSLLEKYLKIISTALRGGYYSFEHKYIKQLPIHTIDLSNPKEVEKHDKLVSLVESMLALQKKYHEVRMERDKELYERQINVVDNQIDQLVYELYGLAEEEIKVVEGV